MRSPTDPHAVSLPLVPEFLARDRRVLPSEMGAWAAWSALVYAAGTWWGVPQEFPALAVGLAVGLGLWAAHPRASWGLFAAGIVIASTVVGTAWLDLNPVWVAGGVAGGMAGKLRGAPIHARLQALLAGLAGAGVAALAADALSQAPDAVTTAALIGAGSACALVPLRISWRARPPGKRQVLRTLEPRWREPVLRGSRLHAQLSRERPTEETRTGLSEVACWIYRLGLSLQRLDIELEILPEDEVRERMMLLLDQAAGATDPFLRDRRLATVEHYQRVLAQAERVRLERERLLSLQEYALAYLEEARMGLVLARTLPGNEVPDRLDEVLLRLRSDASEASVLRRTDQEIEAYA